MTATTIVMANTAAVNAQVAVANVEAQESARKACMAYARGYENDRATVTEMREYAACIDKLYPEPLEQGDVMAWKIIVALLIASMVIGVVHAFRDRNNYYQGLIESTFMGAIIGLCHGLIVLLLLAGLYYGVRFLIS